MKSGGSRQRIMASKFNQRGVAKKVNAAKEQSRWEKGYSNDPVGKAFKPNAAIARKEAQKNVVKD